MAFEYEPRSFAIRRDLSEAHRHAWERLAKAGTWWSGAERVAIAAELRQAPQCALCRTRKAALSPHGLDGEHHAVTQLPKAVIDIVHRLATDASRLSRAWYEKTLASGVSEERYVETVAVAVQVISIDAFHYALGLPLEPLPEPVPGEPSRRRPSGAEQEEAWVPMIRPSKLGPAEKDLYGGAPQTGNVVRALSLVPDEVRGWREIAAAQYLADHELLRLSSPRAIDRAQIELVAGRVSALNECFY